MLPVSAILTQGRGGSDCLQPRKLSSAPYRIDLGSTPGGRSGPDRCLECVGGLLRRHRPCTVRRQVWGELRVAGYGRALREVGGYGRGLLFRGDLLGSEPVDPERAARSLRRRAAVDER
jgi:hypothetical protein